MTLDKGRKNNQLLIQPQYSPMPVGEQIAILYCGTHALMSGIRIDRVKEFQKQFLDRMRSTHASELEVLASGKLTPEIEDTIKAEAGNVCRLLEK